MSTWTNYNLCDLNQIRKVSGAAHCEWGFVWFTTILPFAKFAYRPCEDCSLWRGGCEGVCGVHVCSVKSASSLIFLDLYQSFFNQKRNTKCGWGWWVWVCVCVCGWSSYVETFSLLHSDYVHIWPEWIQPEIVEFQERLKRMRKGWENKRKNEWERKLEE